MKVLDYNKFRNISESEKDVWDQLDLSDFLILLLDAFGVKLGIEKIDTKSTDSYLGADLEKGAAIEIFRNKNSDFLSVIKIFSSPEDVTPNFCYRKDIGEGEISFDLEEKGIPNFKKQMVFSDLLCDPLCRFLAKTCFNQIDLKDKDDLLEDYEKFKNSFSKVENDDAIRQMNKIYTCCLGTFLSPSELELKTFI